MILTHMVLLSFFNGAGGTPVTVVPLSTSITDDSSVHGALSNSVVTPSPTYGRTRGMPFPPGQMRS